MDPNGFGKRCKTEVEAETEVPKLLDLHLVLEIMATTTPMTSLTPRVMITQSGSSRVRRTTTTRNRTR